MPYFPVIRRTEELFDAKTGELLKNGPYEEYFRFLDEWIPLYCRTARKFLSHGRHIRPPQFRCDRARYSHNWRGRVSETDMPSVFISAYEAPDGSRALMFGNWTEARQLCAYLKDGEWMRVTLKPCEIRLMEQR